MVDQEEEEEEDQTNLLYHSNTCVKNVHAIAERKKYGNYNGMRRVGKAAGEVFTALCPECRDTAKVVHYTDIPVGAFKASGPERDLLQRR